MVKEKQAATTPTTRAFDPKKLKAEIEELLVADGPLMGQRMRVLPWQMEVLESVADYRTTALTIGRGNGKSSFIAALCCSAITPGKELFVEGG